MRKKTIIAVLTACMMLLILLPSAAFAASAKKELKSSIPVVSGVDEEYAEQLRQLALELLDMFYVESIEPKGAYCSEVWAEILAAYRELMAQIDSMNEDDLYIMLVDE
ncbi:hypothetical protein P0G10_19600, partial [Eubacteriales bacterium DFI.9.88]|nr:hypothetical protein [Eubacteriales bacterium DFI.9.88]